MDIRQLKHLVSLVEQGTVHAAAEDQFISQPGLSGSIKRLETQLGVELFERDGRGMKPNAKGKDFYHHAKHILEQLRLAQAELNGAPSSLFVGLGEVRPSGFAAVIHDALLQSYPHLSLTFVEEHFQVLNMLVENGEVDVAFVAAIPDSVPSTLTGQTLVKSEWRVYCAIDHPLSQYQGSVPLDELKQFSWVRNAAAPQIAPFVPQFIGYEENPLGDVCHVTADSQQLAKDLVMHSNVLGFGPRITWDSELAHGQIVELELPITKLYANIMGIRRRDAYSAVLDRAFAIVEEYFRCRDLDDG